ncbi:MAG: hypothetical protein KF704_15050 [Crocinitomicaceae bacterium]|nr:hypothetical protein [Crocinitomicaceae bacterium]
MNRFTITIVVCLLTNYTFTQEDSTFLKEIRYIPEVTINATGQTVFKQPNIHLLDFHVDEKGTFLLLKGQKKYFLSRLDAALEMESTVLLSFKPERLHRDCLGDLQIISADSIYRVDEHADGIGVYEPNPISFFYDYYANCLGETKNHLFYKFFSNSNQTVIFNAIDKQNHSPTIVYRAEDSIQVLVADDWRKQIQQDGYSFNAQMQEINTVQLSASRDKFQDLMFYTFVISRPDYIPLFTRENEVCIFDHYNDLLVHFNSNALDKPVTQPISYHKQQGWRKELLYDGATETFYTTFSVNGHLYVTELSKTDFSPVKSIRVHYNSFPNRLMIHGGFLYYDYTSSFEDSYKKLFRQQL